MNELATAVFAAQSGSHLLDAPRTTGLPHFSAGLTRSRSGSTWPAAATGGWLEATRPFRHACARSTIRRRGSSCAVRHRSICYGSRRSRWSVRVLALRTARRLPPRSGGSWPRAGVVVVSGLARGIDAVAHRGALELGLTVAVLGCGIDRDYPRAHAALAAQIAATGLIVSEYPPGVEPAPWRFPARNRLVAGLALATVVVEARERSGALITADFALDEGREVLTVPGEITSQLSKGTNALLRLGAIPVTCAADVLDAIGVEPPPAPEPPVLAGTAAQRAGGRCRRTGRSGRVDSPHGPLCR